MAKEKYQKIFLFFFREYCNDTSTNICLSQSLTKLNEFSNS